MRKYRNAPFKIASIAQQHRLLSLPAPAHPLVSLLNFADTTGLPGQVAGRFSLSFYLIALQQQSSCRVKYGQQYVDFTQGVLSFVAPGQLLSWETNDGAPTAGWLLSIHPDFLRNHPLGHKISRYGFFSYALSEALYLAPPEEEILNSLVKNIAQECSAQDDGHSQDVIISCVELLLAYANRFYLRQFSRQQLSPNDLLAKVEAVLADYLNSEPGPHHGLPTVRAVSAQLSMSPNYLSDELKKLTGKSTQQHIHQQLLERAQQLLASSGLSVSEIAYALGFEHPQSFSKLFKQKTTSSPLAFRNSFR